MSIIPSTDDALPPDPAAAVRTLADGAVIPEAVRWIRKKNPARLQHAGHTRLEVGRHMRPDAATKRRPALPARGDHYGTK